MINGSGISASACWTEQVCTKRKQSILIWLWQRSSFAPSAFSQAEVAVEKSTPTPTTAQIIEQMQRHDQQQARTLQAYEGLRHYSVVYRGFTRTITASMDVEVQL